MEIRELQKEIHKNAADHGWWEPQKTTVGHDPQDETNTSQAYVQRTFGDLIALCHSELSEALEAFRDRGLEHWTETISNSQVSGKPEGAFVEIADCVIRILDMSEFYGVDLQSIIEEKHEYNKLRPYRHGGKKL